MIASLCLALAPLPAFPQEDKYPWPPIGPSWETDPAAAFARARKEKKVVLVYVATGG